MCRVVVSIGLGLFFAFAQLDAGAMQLASNSATDSPQVRDIGPDVSSLDDRQTSESERATWDLFATSEGAPSMFSADVVASVDIDELVVVMYVNGILVDSLTDPASVVLDLGSMDIDPAATSVSLVARDARRGECDQIDGAIAYRNVKLSRQSYLPAALADAVKVAVTGEDPIDVANLAAAVELEMLVPGSTVVLDAPVVVEALSDVDHSAAVFAGVTGLADQYSFSAVTLGEPAAEQLRTIQRADIDLDRSGGSTFISATGFGGRVGSVRADGEIFTTPLAAGGGFAIEVNEVVVASGDIDDDGRGTFAADVEDWPRDARVAVQLALREDRRECSIPVEGYRGSASLSFTPLRASFDAPRVTDFPQRLLESETISLWVDDEIESEWVAVTIAALQDTSVVPLRFHAADDPATAAVHLSAGAGGVRVVADSLNFQLDDETVAELSVDRFWNFGNSVEALQTSVAADVVSIDADDGLETPQAGWLITIAVAMAAVAILLLFKRNSRQAP